MSAFVQRHQAGLMAAAGGAATALTTPPSDIYPAMAVGLVLLALAIDKAKGFWSGVVLGGIWATTSGLIGLRFVPSVIMLFTELGTAAAVLAHLLLSWAQSIHWSLGMGLAALLHQRVRAPLELALGAGVLLAVSLPTVFSWTPAGLLSPHPILVQGADLIGERGVTVVWAIIAALLVRAIGEAKKTGPRRWRKSALPLLAATTMLATTIAYGAWAMAHHQKSGHTVKLGLVQIAVHPRARWKRKNWPSILKNLRQQTEAAEAAGVELTIWPEAAYPYPLRHHAKRLPRGHRSVLGGSVNGPVLFGFIASEPAQRDEAGNVVRNRFNSATLTSADQPLQASYDKMELLWFGETVPLGQQFPWLRRAFQRSGGLVPGRRLNALELPRSEAPALRIGVLNCYEDTLSSLGRRQMRELRPNLLVNITNDAWFVGTEEPELHLRLSVMRSIELRRDLVRSVNLGVVAWVDAAGVVRQRSSPQKPSFAVVEPTVRDTPPTFYARFGDLPLALSLAFGIAVTGLSKRRRPSPPAGHDPEGQPDGSGDPQSS